MNLFRDKMNSVANWANEVDHSPGYPTPMKYEPRCEKTGRRGFRPGPTQTGLYSHRRLLETWDFGFRK